MIRAKRNIKYRLSNFARITGKYQKESIVVIDTGLLTKQNKKKNYQFVSIDITLYNKVYIYDRENIKTMMNPLVKDIIQNDINNPDVFNFILKVRGMEQYGE
jgi:hypothetical protein